MRADKSPRYRYGGKRDLFLGTEPIERVMVAAEAAGVTVATPRPGGSIEPTRALEVDRWWPELPWRTAEEYPIVATKMDE